MDHPYMDHWWVPGLTIGYEHTVAHAIADCLNGVETGTPAEPTFRTALQTQRVCDAILQSAKTGPMGRDGRRGLSVTLAGNVVAMAAIVEPKKVENSNQHLKAGGATPSAAPAASAGGERYLPGRAGPDAKASAGRSGGAVLHGDAIDRDFGKEGSRTRRAIGHQNKLRRLSFIVP